MSHVRTHKWFLAAVVLVLIVNILAVAMKQGGDLDLSSDRSSYRFNAFGYRAWYRLLTRLGYDVMRVETPAPEGLEGLDQFWLINPTEPLKRPELRALRQWVLDGGHLICAFDGNVMSEVVLDEGFASEFMDPANHEFPELAELALSSDQQAPFAFILQSDVDAIHTESVAAQEDALFCEDVGSVLVPLRGRVEDGGDGADVVLADDKGIVFVRKRVGDGVIIATANPDVFANKWIGEADNACLAVNLASEAPGYGAIGIDEYHHGFRAMATVSDVAVAFKGRWGLVQVAAVALLALAVAGRRFGTARTLARKPRRSALEYVDSMAGLYRKASARTAAVMILRRAARRRLARRVGASPAVSDNELMTLVAARRVCDPMVAKAVLLLAEKRETECATDDDLIEVARRLDSLGGSHSPYGGA